MKLLYVFLITIFLITFGSVITYANNHNDEYEVLVNQLYKNIMQMTNPPINNEDIIFQNSHNVIKSAYEIIKRRPASLESYLSLIALNNDDFNFNDEAISIYKNFKSKYFQDLENVNKDCAEKLFFIKLYLLFDANVINTFPNENYEKNKIKCMDALEKFKNECEDKNYSALATIILFLLDHKKEKAYDTYFIDTFPNHTAIPYIKLEVFASKAAKGSYSECISETLKLINEYGNIIVPYGYKFKADCYDLIISCYLAQNDFDKAKQYFILYENEIKTADTELLKSTYINNLRNFVNTTQ